jgi:hypothetical protein
MLAHVDEKVLKEQMKPLNIIIKEILECTPNLNEINLTENDRVLFFWVQVIQHI